MTQPSPVVCPLDGKDDQVQKVTAAASSGADALRRRLQRPEVPPEPSFQPKQFKSNLYKPEENSIWPMLVGSLFLLVVVASIPRLVGEISSGRFNTDMQVQSDILGGLCCALIGVPLVTYWIVQTRKYGRLLNAYNGALAGEGLRFGEDEKERKAQYDKKHSDWVTEKPVIVAMQGVWTSDLYYCHRHDIVFIADPGAHLDSGLRSGVPPERMVELLRAVVVSRARWPRGSQG